MNRYNKKTGETCQHIGYDLIHEKPEIKNEQIYVCAKKHPDDIDTKGCPRCHKGDCPGRSALSRR